MAGSLAPCPGSLFVCTEKMKEWIFTKMVPVIVPGILVTSHHTVPNLDPWNDTDLAKPQQAQPRAPQPKSLKEQARRSFTGMDVLYPQSFVGPRFVACSAQDFKSLRSCLNIALLDFFRDTHIVHW